MLDPPGQYSPGCRRACWHSPFVLNVWETEQTHQIKRRQSRPFLWEGRSAGGTSIRR